MGCSYRSGLTAQATEALGLEHVAEALHCDDLGMIKGFGGIFGLGVSRVGRCSFVEAAEGGG